MTPSANRPCWGLCVLGSAPGSSRNFLDVSGEATHCLVSFLCLQNEEKLGIIISFSLSVQLKCVIGWALHLVSLHAVQ